MLVKMLFSALLLLGNACGVPVSGPDGSDASPDVATDSQQTDTTPDASPDVVEPADAVTDSQAPTDTPAPLRATAIAAGYRHTCAVLSDGTVRCWGANNFGQLGNGTTIDSATPVAVRNVRGATVVSAGDSFSCAAGASVQCWGRDNRGQLGNNLEEPMRTEAVDVASAAGSLPTFTALASGASHTVATSSAGLFAWGDNADGRINADLSPSDRARGVAGAQGAAGNAFTCTISGNSTDCMGTGMRGTGSIAEERPLQVAAGGGTACIVGLDGATRCSMGGSWTRIASLRAAVRISVTHAGVPCAITDTQTAVCEGATVPALPPVRQIVGGTGHTCALAVDGRVLCWTPSTAPAAVTF